MWQRVHGRRRAALPELPRDRRPPRADVRPARRRRLAVHRTARCVAVYNLYRTAAAGRARRATRARQAPAAAAQPRPAHGRRAGIARSRRGPVQFAVADVRRRRSSAASSSSCRPRSCASNVPTIAVGEAVHAARGRGPRPLHPRRLRRLPFADDPADPRRNGALRRVLEGRRVRLRPSVPVGLEADRARTCIASAASIPTPGTSST